jgi:predicted enzyme related to lactoylglutathione lyase
VAAPVAWFEINGPKPDQTAKFFSELFGWHTETVEGGYVLIDTHAGRGINGGFGKPPEGQEAHSIFYAQTPDIQGLLDKASALGSKTVVPVTEIPEMVTFATFTDPFGNLIGLIKGDESESVDVSAGDNPPVDWFELSCSEPQKAWDFYRDLFGWTIDRQEGDGFVHGGVESGSGAVKGGIGSSPSGTPQMILYAFVEDLSKYLERAEGLGAKTVMPSTKVDDHTHIAVFTDPQGNTFGLYATED